MKQMSSGIKAIPSYVYWSFDGG